MIDILLEPFTYSYMNKAFIAATLVSLSCAGLSAYLMLKGWSLMGDALAHAIVPGVSVAYFLKLPFTIGAFFSGILAALSMQLLKNNSKLKEDSIIGVIFSAFFALGLLIISLNPAALSLQKIMLGNLLTISSSDLIQIILISSLVLVALLLYWKDLRLLFFDANHAKSIGFFNQALNMLFFALLSATTVAALQSVGACLVIALLVTPGACAYLLSDKFSNIILIAMSIGLLSSLLGIYLSYFLDSNPGALIVCFQSALFIFLFLFAPKYGLLPQQKKRGST